MPVTEESRHRLHQTLDATIGEEDATTLMEHLPPVGWSDVATNQDLAHQRELLEERIDHRYTLLDHRFDTLTADVDHRFGVLTEDVDHRYRMLDRKIDALDDRFKQVDERFKEITRLFDRQDRRMETLAGKLERQIWHVIGLLGVVGLIIIGFAQIIG